MAGLDLNEFKYLVVEPALVSIGMSSTAALNLVVGTALVESDCSYVKQMGSGPALGLFQMEPATEQDIWNTYLNYQPSLSALVKAAMWPFTSVDQRTEQLIANMRYAAIMCRLKYRRATPPLPVLNDAAGMAAYHKQFYNSSLGKANPTTNIPKFQEAINA